MYRVMIIDDEKALRSLLKASVNLSKYPDFAWDM